MKLNGKLSVAVELQAERRRFSVAIGELSFSSPMKLNGELSVAVELQAERRCFSVAISELSSRSRR